jgi:glucose 1-dehydrogenase
MRLKEKVALITGAAQGIGLACAQAFAREGASVMLSDRDEKAGREAAAALAESGAGASFIACDVSRGEEVRAAVAATVAEFGRLDILVANAGVVHACEFLELKEEDFERVLDVNLKGVFLAGQAAARQMVRQGG